MKVLIKRRSPRPYDDYIDFEKNPYDKDESDRVAKHIMHHDEMKFPLSNSLQSVTPLFVKTQYEKANSIAQKAKRGRPTSIIANSYLAMLVWYRCNIIKEEYTSSIKRDIGLFEIVANSIKITDPQSQRAAKIDGGIDDIQRMDSESSVKRANKYFKKYGFIPGTDVRDTHNEIQRETFCRLALELPSENEIDMLMEKIYNTWMENYFNSQGQ